MQFSVDTVKDDYKSKLGKPVELVFKKKESFPKEQQLKSKLQWTNELKNHLKN